ncbi:hypothetical protein O2W14_04310 [Modestobacter sp. VKM Ac-2986]|uniref:hypothetical protein n=1 Tax=Modestobacter sp. VKM Ac-2986 TaxID=3004140 RepID=UPI0022AA5BFC|nr:hypothetical protein [Modestobacter sp. VKM Ac-2986]MCZ2828056.1 hypothetical protein [Modestobacter sp. VKM Ac-2986]
MATPSRGATGLIVVALVMLVGFTAWVGPAGWQAGGWWSAVLFGVPLTCAAGALVAERGIRGRLAPVVVGALAVVSLGWSLLTGLGIGLGFLLPALLLVVATLVSGVDRATGTRGPLPG